MLVRIFVLSHVGIEKTRKKHDRKIEDDNVHRRLRLMHGVLEAVAFV